jgi:hypothetical protein
MEIPKIFNKTELANEIYPFQKQAKATLNNKLKNNQGRELNNEDLEKLLDAAKKGVKDLKIQMAYDWEYLNDNDVMFYYLNDKTDTVDRSLFNDYIKEVGLFERQISEDDFEPYTPTEGQYKQAEKEFWNDFFNIK